MNLFNFENMINENYSFSDCLHSVQTDEVYLHRTLRSLTKLNESVSSSIKKLGVSVLEAESRKEENQCFCVAFKEFKDTIVNFISDMNVTVGKFAVELENIVNANKDLLDSDDYINNYDGCIDQYQVKGYTHLTDDFPSISPILIYKKEFDKIGKLMQDIGALAPNDAKLQIIATVYNEFSKEISTDWNDKFIKEIFGDTANSDNYAEILYAAFRTDSCCKPVTKSMLFNAKNALMGYNTLIDSTTASIKKVLDEFEKIALDVESMVFRNEDYKLKINTPTDGVENRDYQLDEYSINQFDIFMKAKISQMVQLCNLYSIAVSIKLDAIKEYINSNKDLLEKASECGKCCCNNQSEEVSDNDSAEDVETPEEPESEEEPPVDDHGEEDSIDVDDQDDFYNDHKELPTPEVEPEEDETSNDQVDNNVEDSEDDDNEIADDTSDTFYDDDSISSATKPDDEQPIAEEEPEEVKEPDEMDTAEVDNSDMDDIEKESYLMDYHLFTLDRILEQEDIINALTEAMVLEDGEQPAQPSGDNNGGNNNNLNSDLLKNAKGVDLVHFLIAQIKKLYNMFNQKFVVNINKKKKLLENNKQYIIGAEYKSMKQIADKQKSSGSDGNAEEFKTLQHVDPNALSNAKVSDFEVRVDNYSNDDIKNKFESDASFFKAAYGDIAKNYQAEGQVSINKYIENLMISGENVTWDQCDHSNIDIEAMFNWCTGEMSKIMDNLNKQFNQIMKLESKLSVVVKNFEKQAADNGAQQVSKQTNQNSDNNGGGEGDNTQKQESYSLSSTMNDYFAEATAGTIPKDVKKQAGDAASQFNKMLKIYISVNSKLLSGEMSGYHKIFNEFYSLLNIVSKFNGRPSEQKNNNGQNTEQNSN